MKAVLFQSCITSILYILIFVKLNFIIIFKYTRFIGRKDLRVNRRPASENYSLVQVIDMVIEQLHGAMIMLTLFQFYIFNLVYLILYRSLL